MMKYAIILGIVMAVGGGYLAYRLGISDCRTDNATAAVEQVRTVSRLDAEIVRRVMSVSDDDNLDWLLREYRRAD